MSKKDKLIERFKRLPSDFTFDELVTLLGYMGYELDNRGATSGSRIRFKNGHDKIDMHKPHPGSIIKEKTLYNIYKFLKLNGLM